MSQSELFDNNYVTEIQSTAWTTVNKYKLLHHCFQTLTNVGFETVAVNTNAMMQMAHSPVHATRVMNLMSTRRAAEVTLASIQSNVNSDYIYLFSFLGNVPNVNNKS